jgi:hypothetical protein
MSEANVAPLFQTDAEGVAYDTDKDVEEDEKDETLEKNEENRPKERRNL